MRHTALSAAVSGVLLALVSGLLATVVTTTSANAATKYLCFGYSGCSSRGMGHAGYAQNNGRMYWRMYPGHNCTNYVAYRLVKKGMANSRPWSGGGNAHYWGLYNSGKTDRTPRVGAVAWWKRYSGGAGSSGHVAYVEKVISPTTIVVSQDSWGGDFSWKRIEKGDGGWPTGFIHFIDKSIENVAKPSVQGTAKVGEELTATTGRWRGGSTKKSFQWFAGGKPVRGARSRALTLGPEHVKKRIAVKVVARRKGFTPGTAMSPSTGKVAKGEFRVTEPTTVDGAPRVGETLTAKPASFAPKPGSVRVQWRADNKIIGRGARLRVTKDQVGKQIKAISIARGDGYKLTGSHTEEVGPVTMGKVEVTQAFRVTGKPRLGWKLTVQPGEVQPEDATTSYRWQADGQPIPGATGRRHQIQKSDLGKRISVSVTASRKNYDPWTQQLGVGKARTFAKLHVRAVGGKRHVRVTLRAWAKGGFKPWGDAKVRIGKHWATVNLRKGYGQTRINGITPGERKVWARVVPDERYLRRRASATVTVRR